MVASLRVRLGVLMWLQYFMFGVWFVPLGTYMSKGLHFDGVIGIAYGSQGFATLVSAFLVGTLADRYFASQKLLATLFFLSALTLVGLATRTVGADAFVFLAFLHFLVFIPTIPLVNSLCFRWLADPALDFPRIRVLGTVGWIVSGLAVGAISGAAETRLPLLIGAAAGVVLACYALTLPHTPPEGRRPRPDAARGLGLAVVRSQAGRPFWILLAATFMIMVPMAFYYAYFNNFLVESNAVVVVFGQRWEGTALQSLGQVSELVFLLLLPFFLARVGIKGVFLLGIGSWTLRYALFAFAYRDTGSVLWMLIVGILIHGVSNDFIQVAGQVYVNKEFSAETRSRAQALFTTVLMGFGAIVGSLIANAVYGAATFSPVRHDWFVIWTIPAGVALLTLIWFWWSFPRNDLPRTATRH